MRNIIYLLQAKETLSQHSLNTTTHYYQVSLNQQKKRTSEFLSSLVALLVHVVTRAIVRRPPSSSAAENDDDRKEVQEHIVIQGWTERLGRVRCVWRSTFRGLRNHSGEGQIEKKQHSSIARVHHELLWK